MYHPAREFIKINMAKEVKINRTGIAVVGALGLVVVLFLVYQTRGGGYVEKTVKISELISASISLVEQAGKAVVGVRKMDDKEIEVFAKGQTKEGKDEYVTLGDKLSHQIIVSGLKSLWPSLPFQSEESNVPDIEVKSPVPKFNEEVMKVAQRDEEVPMDAVTVWIDPLDATQEYTEGKEELLKYVTVMVCIAIKGKPIAGVIHQPYDADGKDEEGGVTKWAWVGHDSSLSLTKAVEPHTSKTTDSVRVIVSRSHPGDVTKVAEDAFKDSGQSVEPIKAAGAGYKALQVVEGRADLYLHTTAIKKWDICAGDAILKATGGQMTTRKGEEIDYSFEGSPKNLDGIIAAKTANHDKYLDKLKL